VIAWEESGDGPPVVLVHGLTEERRLWDSVVPLLEPHFRCLRLDLPGHGASADADAYGPATMSEAIAGVVDEAGVDEAPIVVGHSLGAVAVTFYATQAPVRAVVNLDQPMRVGDFARALAPLRDALRGDGFDAAVAAIFDTLGMEGVPADVARQIEALHHAARQDVVVGYWATVLDSDPDDLDDLVTAALQQLAVPYVSIHGRDPGADYVDWLTARMPTSTVEVWGTGGHYPHLADPERFAARVRQLV
jgi:pimeloyl-ACP methyl ester carboxylesterase